MAGRLPLQPMAAPSQDMCCTLHRVLLGWLVSVAWLQAPWRAERDLHMHDSVRTVGPEELRMLLQKRPNNVRMLGQMITASRQWLRGA